MKEKVVLAISLLRYELSNIFVGRSMYMQQRTGSFKEGGSKNTFYRFLNATKTNWLRFTSLLAAVGKDEVTKIAELTEDQLSVQTSDDMKNSQENFQEIFSRLKDHFPKKQD